MSDFDAGSIEARLDVDRDPFVEGLRLAQRQAQDFADSKYEASLGADTRTGEASLAAFKGRLDEVDASRVNVRVDADTSAADAQLALTEEEARRLGQQSPTVRVDADTAAARANIAGIWTWAAALGPIAIPVVAAGIGGLAGLTAGLGAVAGAAGTAYLGFHGVTDAVKAMDKASESAGSTATRSAGAQAKSADQLRLAEMSLANARATAADQAISSEQRIEDAQRQERDAQTALTDARRQATDQIASYRLQLEDAALAERHASLSVREARQQLNAVRFDWSATPLQRQEARLAYDEAVQQQKDLLYRNSQLKDQAATASREGVDGNQQVVAATERVQSAEQAVADARRQQAAQQRQSALSIAQAQEQVANANRAVGGAAASSSADVNKLQEAMDKLSPAGQHFALFIHGLKDDVRVLRDTAQGGLLPGVEAGITAVLPLLPRLNTFVGQVSTSMGIMAEQDAKALNTPFWQQFFTYVDREAVPTLAQMNATLGNSAHGWAGLLMAFEPVERQMGNGLVRLSDDFAKFGENAGTDSEFQHFLFYVEANGPRVVHTLGDIAHAGGSLLASLSVVGGPLLMVVDDLAKLVSMNPDLVAFGIEVYSWNRIFTSVATSARAAATSVGLFGAAEEATAAKTAAANAETQASAPASSKAAGGFNLLAIAATALTVGYTQIIGYQRKYSDEQKLGAEQSLLTAHSYSVLNAQLQAQHDQLEKAANQNLNPLKWLGKGQAADAASETLERLHANVTVVQQDFHTTADGALELAQAAGVDLSGSITTLLGGIDRYLVDNGKLLVSNAQLRGTILEVDAAFYQAKGGIGAYAQAIQVTTGVQMDAFDATLQYKDQLAQVDGLHLKNKHSIDLNTKAGRENLRVVEQAVRTAEAQAAAVADQAYRTSKATTEEGKNRDAVNAGNAALAKNVDRLHDQLRAAGLSEGQVKKLLTQMGILGHTTSVGKVAISGYDTAMGQLNAIAGRLALLSSTDWQFRIGWDIGAIPSNIPGVTPPPTVSAPKNLNDLLIPHAAGGPFGPYDTMLVGERGPEVVRFNRGGTVIPNEQLGWQGPVAGADSGEIAGLLRTNNALLAEQNARLGELAQIAAASPGALAGALNDVAHSSAHMTRGVPTFL